MQEINITGKCKVYNEIKLKYNEIKDEEKQEFRELLKLKGINYKTLKQRDMDVESYMKEKLLEIRNSMIDEYREEIGNEIFWLLKKMIEEETKDDRNFLQKLTEGLKKDNNFADDFFNDFLNKLDSILNCVSHYINCSVVNENYLNDYEVHIKLKGNEDVRLLKVIKNKLKNNKTKENETEYLDL